MRELALVAVVSVVVPTAPVGWVLMAVATVVSDKLVDKKPDEVPAMPLVLVPPPSFELESGGDACEVVVARLPPSPLVTLPVVVDSELGGD